MDHLRRANRDDEQHLRRFETIEGGRRSEAEAEIGADLTRSPFDESLVRDENGALREDRADAVTGYGEPLAEKNYPSAYNRDELINTDYNPAMEFPRKRTVVFNVTAILLGLVAFALLLWALFANFLAPSRRTPEGNRGAVHSTARNTIAVQQFASFVHRLNERR